MFVQYATNAGEEPGNWAIAVSKIGLNSLAAHLPSSLLSQETSQLKFGKACLIHGAVCKVEFQAQSRNNFLVGDGCSWIRAMLTILHS